MELGPNFRRFRLRGPKSSRLIKNIKSLKSRLLFGPIRGISPHILSNLNRLGLVVLLLLKELAEDNKIFLGGRAFRPKSRDKGLKHCVQNARGGMRRARKDKRIVG
jgi:hypothetical protein